VPAALSPAARAATLTFHQAHTNRFLHSPRARLMLRLIDGRVEICRRFDRATLCYRRSRFQRILFLMSSPLASTKLIESPARRPRKMPWLHPAFYDER